MEEDKKAKRRRYYLNRREKALEESKKYSAEHKDRYREQYIKRNNLHVFVCEKCGKECASKYHTTTICRHCEHVKKEAEKLFHCKTPEEKEAEFIKTAQREGRRVFYCEKCGVLTSSKDPSKKICKHCGKKSAKELRALAKARYLAKREQFIEYSKKWNYELNKLLYGEKICEICGIPFVTSSKNIKTCFKCRQSIQKIYKNDLQKARKLAADYYYKNKEKILQQKKEYRATHKRYGKHCQNCGKYFQTFQIAKTLCSKCEKNKG